jgi:bacterioferritin (cytochrome b1)
MVLEACREGASRRSSIRAKAVSASSSPNEIAIDHHRELIRHFGERDPGTRTMLEGILVVEEEHANDMHDLLVAHEGKLMLPK